MRAVICCGLGWGDESKGSCVDALTRKLPVDLIVRFNGASQCAHNVVTPEGLHHTFSQFGSGMLANNTVRTHLSRFMLINPISMMREAEALNKKTSNVWWRTTVDKNAVIITPYHRMLNQLRERARGDARHGSCGVGVGVARELHLEYGDDAVVLAKDCIDYDQLYCRLCSIEEIVGDKWVKFCVDNGIRFDTSPFDIDKNELIYQYMHWPAKIVDGLEPSECIVFEGAQGVLLDETHGTAPHNTWTDTTFNNADVLLDEVGVASKDRFRIGCLRTYHTRHGAGPFPTEDNTLDLPEPHNGTGEFQGAFRVGRFDPRNLKYALDIVGKVDAFSVSHLDYLSRLDITDNFTNDLELFTGIPVVMKANGPTAAHRTLELGVYA